MSLPPLPYRRAVLMLLSLCLLSLLSTTAQAQQPEPTIVDTQIGFGGVYKLGCWTPINIELQGGSQAYTGRVVVTVPDSDGVPTRVLSEANRPVGITPGQTTQVRLFVRVGQSMSPVKVQFFSEDGKERAKRTFNAGSESRQGVVPGGVPSTNRLLLEFGPTLGLGELVQNEGRSDEQLKTRIARIEQADDLPTRWYGYESVETVLLTTSEPELYRPLQQNGRIEALQKWVERGGQLVIFCAESAEELLADGGVLASLAPGKYEKMERLSQAQPLATFSGSEQPISRDRRIDLSVPSLLDVRGQILASAGRSATNVPLVVRTRRGLGEIVFVGLDFDRPPLRDWAGRTSFLRRVLDWKENDKNQQTDGYHEAEDLVGHLRNSLDKKFIGVQVVPFGLVALLVGGYILLIGPGDYFFVKRILRRTELTWLTFPLIVLGVSAAAYGIANKMKGDQLRVNQVEIIDVDLTGDDADDDDSSSHFARGTVWTHFFTPQVSEFNLRLQPSVLGQTELAGNEQLVSWLGLPGYALGGMQASGSQTSVFDAGYQYGPGHSSMQRLPVQVWSTKTLTARWSAQVDSPLKYNLGHDGEELLRGTITNDSGVELEDCMLFYGRWAYNLGRMPVVKSFEIDDSLQPRTVKTLLTNATAGDDTVTQTADDGTVPYKNAEWDIARLVKTMMFYESLNGHRYTGKHHRYQSFVDLSTLLKQNNQAILLAKCAAPGSQWLANAGSSTKRPLASDQDRRWTYYRFVLKVESPGSNE